MFTRKNAKRLVVAYYALFTIISLHWCVWILVFGNGVEAPLSLAVLGGCMVYITVREFLRPLLVVASGFAVFASFFTVPMGFETFGKLLFDIEPETLALALQSPDARALVMMFSSLFVVGITSWVLPLSLWKLREPNPAN